MAKRGRPSKYQKEFNSQVEKACRIWGATTAQLAEFLGVSDVTIETWMKEHADFLGTLKQGKDAADAKVEASLYKRATGYTRMVQKVTKDGDIVDLQEELPPDPTSMIFWLKNRDPTHWRDKREIEMESNVRATISDQPMSIDEWEKTFLKN